MPQTQDVYRAHLDSCHQPCSYVAECANVSGRARRRCFWPLPLMRVLPPAGEAELVESYLALLAMPKPLIELPGGPVPGDTSVAAVPAEHAHTLLAAADAELGTHLDSVLGRGGAGLLLEQAAERLCVGLLGPEAVLFVWDLCLLGGWQQLQPALSAALLCLRDGLLSASSAEDLTAYVQVHAPSIAISQLRETLESHFMPSIRSDLGASAPSDVRTLPPSELSF